MPAVTHRLEFAPPMPQGTGRAFGLAVLAHLFLAGALTWGVSWKREATVATVEAELWSTLPQQAAPKLQEAAPPPPQPVAKTEPAPAKAPEIVTEKIKPKPEPKPEVKPLPKPEPKPQVNKALEERKLAEQREAERLKNVERIAGLAGASGAPNAIGTAQQSSSMASGWDARVKARVNPQIIYTGERTSLKALDLSITILSDGTISGRPRVVKSSGSQLWDEAVVRAFEKAESLPRDANGKLPPSPFLLTWNPRE